MTRFVSRSFSAGTRKNHDLADAHHNVPGHDVDAVGRELVVPACLFQVLVYLIDRFRLVVPQKDRQQEGARLRHGGTGCRRLLGHDGERIGCRAQGGKNHGRRNRTQLFASPHPATPHVEKPMLFVMVNASPGGVNRQVVVLSRPGRCNRPRMGVDT
jgi:hypothetical protein